MPEQQATLLSYFRDFLIQDWFASIPISICLILMIAVVIERSIYYSRNQRNLGSFIRKIQGELEQGNLDQAMSIAKKTGGLLGLVTEEALRLIQFHSKNFANSFDISASLYIRDLEKRLPTLSTIGATCPFLGLFGTVVGVIVTLKLLGEQGGQSAEVVVGVAKALIATGYGLIVAIVAVIWNNYFNGVVNSFENDFQIIKLTFLDYLQSQSLKKNGGNGQTNVSANNIQMNQQQPVATGAAPSTSTNPQMPPQPHLPYNPNQQ